MRYQNDDFNISQLARKLSRRGTVVMPQSKLSRKGSFKYEGDKNLIYHPSKYHEQFQPICIYIPSDVVIIEMMRACCYAQEWSDTIFGMMEAKEQEIFE